jgi:hypothetical protein
LNKNLPYLTPERLKLIFNDVYAFNLDDEFKESLSSLDDKMSEFIYTLKQMQRFNYLYRPEDTINLFEVASKIFYFQPNSDGPIIILALMLAIKELYGFSDQKLIQIMKQADFNHL